MVPAAFRRCSAVEVVVGTIPWDLRAAGDDLAGVVVHVLVRERHAVQGPARAPGERGVGRLRRARALLPRSP